MVKKKRKLISNLKSSKKKGLSQFVLRQPLFIIPQAQTCLQACGIIKKTNCAAAGFGYVKLPPFRINDRRELILL